MKNKLMIFEGNNVEVFDYNGRVLFNPKHVGSCLDISDKTVGNHVAEMNENKRIKITNSVSPLKGIRKLNNAGEVFITESGVYDLIFKSRKSTAIDFKDWVTDTVLPTIRKTGGFVSDDREEEFIDKYFPSFSDDVKKGMVLDLHSQNKKYKDEIKLMTPKVEYHDNILNSDSLITTTDVAKDVGMSASKLNKILHEHKVIYPKLKSKWNKKKEIFENKPTHYIPYSAYEFLITDGYADYHITSYDKGDGKGSKQTLKWKEKGRKWIIEFIESIGE